MYISMISLRINSLWCRTSFTHSTQLIFCISSFVLFCTQWRRNEFESGGGAPVRSKSGGTDPAQSAGKKFFGRAPPLFGSESTISRFGERFHDGQYGLVSFLFAVLLLTVSPVPSHLQKWGHVPSVPHGVGATDCTEYYIMPLCFVSHIGYI